MTDEEALQCFEDDCWRCRQRKSCERLEKRGGSPCRNINAMSALRDRVARQNPQPLTLEELCGMDGEPVYLVIEDVNGIEPLTMWVLVEVDGDGIWLTNSIGGRSYYEDTLNDGISAYRRKPEGSENE